ncbi:hypothetical protein J437_LFUL005582 [Ladona fulva]|uniref:RRM domain-containing protein n=1 Tax=Ladona fulva TaxID=123851 RepID=A0A8K0NY04_LADFU|nr:hypothetical protein J437_LFUL005582 [Ladona fulva]
MALALHFSGRSPSPPLPANDYLIQSKGEAGMIETTWPSDRPMSVREYFSSFPALVREKSGSVRGSAFVCFVFLWLFVWTVQVCEQELIMSKLYVGNLPADVNEGTLRQLLLDHSVSCATILVKRGGYAFVDCPDQSMADRAIDKLNDIIRRNLARYFHPLLAER